ncbi:FAD-binding oxidoreductase [Rubrivirga sp.]|uniref:FAD-binding oxidoreductase n=1 Tax=Rubrivirga sp. TaxID=1885344 RepID=UPI003B51A50E
MSVRGYESWGRVPVAPPARVDRLSWRSNAPARLAEAATRGSVLAYGRGRSYGDVCLNGGGGLLDTAGLDRVVAFDREAGVLRAEAGVTLADVLALTLPHGWFLPVTPGTRHVTLGGAVANDVHGKNHHVAGTVGRFVSRLGLVRSTGETLELAPGDPLFAATVGGLGLTGLITDVELRLMRVASDRIDQTTTRFRSLDAFFALSEAANARSPYVVAWLDALRPEGRGLLMEGTHAPEPDLPGPGPAREPRLSVPFDAPEWALSPLAVRAFNAVYFRRQRGEVSRSRVGLGPFFYPLDAVGRWDRGYGRRGFYQYQFVVPMADAAAAVRDVLGRLAAARAGSFLAVLKTFGDVPSPGLMSFPRPGVTLALDLANRGERTVRLLQSCDEVVRAAGGAVYPAKDACMTPASFRAFFPQWEAFAAHLDPAFSSTFWRRVVG